jgi:hypothetical protein
VTLPPEAEIEGLRSRYGTDHGRWGTLLVVALVAVPFLGWVLWAALQHAHQELRWETVGFDNSSSTSVKVNFDVFLPEGSSAECTVRALTADGLEVGRAQVPVHARGDNTTVVYSLQVTARPSSAFVDTCRLTD